MSSKISKYQIPFNQSGNLCRYCETWALKDGTITMRDNFVFHDTMEIEGYGRGRSAAYFSLKSTTTNKTYDMFLTDFFALIHDCVVTNGIVEANWTFCKRGQNYGMRLATPEEAAVFGL